MEYLFSGSALCAVSAKGAVLLPEFVRFTLIGRTHSNGVMIAPHELQPCLRGYDRGFASFLYDDHTRLRLADEDAGAGHDRARSIFGRSEESFYEPDGAISLPPFMRRKGRLEDWALFVGAGGTFEIWNPQLALESGDKALGEIAAWRLEDRAAA